MTDFPEIPPITIQDNSRLGQKDLFPTRVVTRLLQDGAVTTVKIADASITTAKIQDASITNAKIVDATITTAKIVSLSADKITAGTLSVTVNMGNGQVYIDGANKRIIINDGTNDRILIGYLAGAF